MRERERLHNISYQELRTAAECHRQVRKHMQAKIKPGMLMTDICEELEDLNRKLVQENGLKVHPCFPICRTLILPMYHRNPLWMLSLETRFGCLVSKPALDA